MSQLRKVSIVDTLIKEFRCYPDVEVKVYKKKEGYKVKIDSPDAESARLITNSLELNDLIHDYHSEMCWAEGVNV